MDLAYFIAGSIFLFLSIVWWFIQKRVEVNKKYEEAKSDAKKAVDSGNSVMLLDAIRRMHLYR
jgi:hypothetical protein